VGELALVGGRVGPQLRDHHDDPKRAVRGASQSDAGSPRAGDMAGPAWLGEEPADPRQLKALLAPYPSAAMTCWPVSLRVGNVTNNDASLIEPIALQV